MSENDDVVFDMSGDHDAVALSEELSARNDDVIRSLRAQGYNVEMVSILGTRLAALCDHVMGPLYYVNDESDDDSDNEPNRLRGEFELELQRKYAEQLAQAQSQITRSVLLNGVRGQG